MAVGAIEVSAHWKMVWGVTGSPSSRLVTPNPLA